MCTKSYVNQMHIIEISTNCEDSNLMLSQQHHYFGEDQKELEDLWFDFLWYEKFVKSLSLLSIFVQLFLPKNGEIS